MIRRLNGELLSQWVKENGEHEAVARIVKRTGLKTATIDKMLGGRYESQPSFLVRKELLELTQLDEDKLFPMAATKGKAS